MKNNMNSKKWIKILAVLCVLGVGFVGGINYLVDPLWTFSHSNKLNSKQGGFDERQQKTNNVYFNGLDDYNGILLGSSRTTFINQNDFKNMNIFNYSSSSMYPHEYKGYIDFAKKVKGEELEYIVIGADFFGTNIPKDLKFNTPEFYINNSISALYRYKMLFSLDALKKSLSNIKNSFKGAKQYYDRNNVKYQPKVSESERLKRYTTNLKRHTNELSYPKYTYNTNYIEILKQIKQENPNTKFIIFTSAITSDLLVSIIKNGKRINEFEKWLKELIDVFGTVHHFMTINSVTKNLQNYPDDDHAYPHIVKMIANKLSDTTNNKIPNDFGKIITKENVDEYIAEFKKQIETYNLKF